MSCWIYEGPQMKNCRVFHLPWFWPTTLLWYKTVLIHKSGYSSADKAPRQSLITLMYISHLFRQLCHARLVRVKATGFKRFAIDIYRHPSQITKVCKILHQVETNSSLQAHRVIFTGGFFPFPNVHLLMCYLIFKIYFFSQVFVLLTLCFHGTCFSHFFVSLVIFFAFT